MLAAFPSLFTRTVARTCKNVNVTINTKIFTFLYSTSAATNKNAEGLEPIKIAYSTYESTSTRSPDSPCPLVVLHGLFGSKANWNSLCKVMHQKTSPQRKIVAADLRNHGDSPHSEDHTYAHLAEDVRELCRQLKIKKTALLGHSMGGRVVMYFALKYPELVDKLIVADISPVSTGPSLKSMPTLFEAMKNVTVPKNIPMSAARISIDMQLTKTINDKGLRSFLLTNLVQKLNGSFAWRINLDVLSKNFEKHIATFPNTTNLTFDGPTLFVGGGKSDFLQKTDHLKIKQLFPNAQFTYIEGAGHWVHSEKPNEFLKVVLDFLNKDIVVR